MTSGRPTLFALLRIAAAVLVLRVTCGVLIECRNYFPANFESDFLLGREAHFNGLYWWAFYAHVIAGPPTLLLGMMLLSERLRSRSPRGHAILGRVQATLVLLLLVPSGLVMAPYATTGRVAAAGFATLAVATAATMVWGIWAARMRRFEQHRRWMMRNYLLLASAVVIRLMGGLATVLGAEQAWIYSAAAWLSWLGPLVIYELTRQPLVQFMRPATDAP